jgi:hypothetical protein
MISIAIASQSLYYHSEIPAKSLLNGSIIAVQTLRNRIAVARQSRNSGIVAVQTRCALLHYHMTITAN